MFFTVTYNNGIIENFTMGIKSARELINRLIQSESVKEIKSCEKIIYQAIDEAHTQSYYENKIRDCIELLNNKINTTHLQIEEVKIELLINELNIIEQSNKITKKFIGILEDDLKADCSYNEYIKYYLHKPTIFENVYALKHTYSWIDHKVNNEYKRFIRDSESEYIMLVG